MVTDYWYINNSGQLVSEDGSTIPIPRIDPEYDAVASQGSNGSGIGSDSPCLVSVEVNGILYLDLEQSIKDSPPSVTGGMILEASRKVRGELPLLGGLERRIVEEKRRNARELWANGPKGHYKSHSSISTSASP